MSYVFLDIETTGLDADTCFITEVAAVKTNEYGDVIEEINMLVALPEGESVPEFITELTGITDGDLIEAGVRIDFAMDTLKQFIGEDVVIAQYAPFDLSFIEKHFEVKNFFDTRTMAYELRLPGAKLNQIAEHYGIEMAEHHRALSDAMTCASIFFEMMEEIGGSRLGEFLNVVGTKPERMPKIYPIHTITVVDYAEKEGDENRERRI